MSVLDKNLDFILKHGIESMFKAIHRGIEKESLRVNPYGAIAMTSHPSALGSALAHPSITTDYSESQLEFVSPVSTNIDTLTNFLTDVHHYTYQNIGDEKLWVNSMPCIVRKEKDIPIARFGISNVAKMKEVYRKGLGYRYGRLMQTICGIHYNFSLPKQFWSHYLNKDANEITKEDISAQYLKLIRNFHRHSWLLFYLLGASPAVCKTFLKGRKHGLDDLAGNSFYAPNATSLRMSDLGYSNKAQSGIKVCYNELSNYTDSLVSAMRSSHPQYERIGVKVDGKYRQLNANLLQIENEFYASIRPKRVVNSGEKPSAALIKRGIEYVEVRCIDLNPYVPIGIDQETIVFLDMFLLYCLLAQSPEMGNKDLHACKTNNQKSVMNGREPDIKLDRDGQKITLTKWAGEVINDMKTIAQMLDSVHFSKLHSQSLQLQSDKINDSENCPSKRILNDIKTKHGSYFDFAMFQSEKHERFFKHLIQNKTSKVMFEQQAATSIAKQGEIEKADKLSFDEYLDIYFA